MPSVDDGAVVLPAAADVDDLVCEASELVFQGSYEVAVNKLQLVRRARCPSCRF